MLKQFWTNEKRKPAKYPRSALKKHFSGCVEFVVGIDNQGKSAGYKVTNAYPPRIFNRGVSASLNGYRWKETQANKTKQPVLITMQRNFIMKNYITIKKLKELVALNSLV